MLQNKAEYNLFLFCNKFIGIKRIEKSIVIIGAGLTGLATAYYLSERGRDFVILESRSRIGGRILSSTSAQGQNIDLGPTWLGKKHIQLYALLESFDIDIVEQVFGERAIFEPISTSPPFLASLDPTADPTYRMRHGTTTLVDILADKIGAQHIHTNTRVTSVVDKGDNLEVHCGDIVYIANQVVSTLPPNLLVNTIKINPDLPADVTRIARSTHTWMSESIKVSLSFPKPFWATEKTSGTIMSNVGPITVMYDHSDYDEKKYSLIGFFHGSYYNETAETRKEMVLKQLQKYYGPVIDTYTEYFESVWQHEKDTHHPYENHVIPHENNGHAVYQQIYLGGKLIIGGTETATAFPGYMEGAIVSAQMISALLK